MARKTISEFSAKTLLLSFIGQQYTGIQISRSKPIEVAQLNATKRYVIKVDSGIKKRFKKGLVKLNCTAEETVEFAKDLFSQGYDQLLVEEYAPHTQDKERYFSVERVRDGLLAHYSDKGGIDIEENKEHIQTFLFPYSFTTSKKSQEEFKNLQEVLGISWEMIQEILSTVQQYHFSFLEINPFVVNDGNIDILDLAVEVDTAGEFFAKSWTAADFTSGSQKPQTPEEKAITDMAEKSPASLKYEIINPDGAVFVLLSGGGASIVVADEVYQQGYGKELANYGEYSGNPTEEETYLYTKYLLRSLLKSKATKKVLIIGGGVANFTDIRKTFLGVIRALREVQQELKEQEVKVFVRRGGPHQKEGLSHMAEFLRSAGLYGDVVGPDKMLTRVVTEAIDYLKQ